MVSRADLEFQGQGIVHSPGELGVSMGKALRGSRKIGWQYIEFFRRVKYSKVLAAFLIAKGEFTKKHLFRATRRNNSKGAIIIYFWCTNKHILWYKLNIRCFQQKFLVGSIWGSTKLMFWINSTSVLHTFRSLWKLEISSVGTCK